MSLRRWELVLPESWSAAHKANGRAKRRNPVSITANGLWSQSADPFFQCLPCRSRSRREALCVCLWLTRSSALSSSLEYKAVFEARALAIGVSATGVQKLIESGFDSLSNYALATTYTQGSSGDTPFGSLLLEVLGEAPPP